MLKKLPLLVIVFIGISLLTIYSLNIVFSKKEEVIRGSQAFRYSNNKGYQLFVDNKPFFIKGVVGHKNFPLMQKVGVNTIRTYDTKNLQAILDSALAYNIKVIVGIYLPVYKRGYEELDKDVIASTKHHVKRQVERYKHHPSILFWMVGNEVVSRNRWNNNYLKLINECSKIVHQCDSSRMVSSCLNHSRLFSPFLHWYCDDLDFVSYNTFGSVFELSDRINNPLYGYFGPHFISEWGYVGQWENETNVLGHSIESYPRDKMQFIQYAFESIRNSRNCIGACAFRWDHYQEASFTRWSLLGPKLSQTPETDALHRCYVDSPSTAYFPAPIITSISVNGHQHENDLGFKPNQKINVKYQIEGNSKEALSLQARVFAEAKKNRDFYYLEKVPPNYDSLIIHTSSQTQEAIIKAPHQRGAYRAYIYVFDGENRSCAKNFPFYVD